jgi:hypothetical protein
VELSGLLEAFQARWHGVRAVYIPPFAKSAKDGHPSFCGWLRVSGGATRRGES